MARRRSAKSRDADGVCCATVVPPRQGAVSFRAIRASTEEPPAPKRGGPAVPFTSFAEDRKRALVKFLFLFNLMATPATGPPPSFRKRFIVRTLLVNHLLEPPHRVTGITRFLFSMVGGLLASHAGRIVLATTWSRRALPARLRESRLEVVTEPFVNSTLLNVQRQSLVLPRLMKETEATAEFNANPLGGVVGRWARIITVHDLYYRLMPKAYPARHRAVWRLLFPVMAQCTSAILVPSESTRQDLSRFYPQAGAKAFVVHEAPGLMAAEEGVPAPIEGRYGLMVGNISPNKNVESIVASLALARDAGTPIPLLHVGRDEEGLIARAQSRLSKPIEIHSLHGIDDGALRAAYANAAFLVNASHHEGFCLPVVEAQACGTPVIASNRSAIPEVAGSGALLVDPDNVAELARALVSVWTDAALARDLIRRGHENAGRFSWEKAARELADKFDQLSPEARRYPRGGAVSKLPT